MVDFTLQITVQGIAFDVFVGSQYVLNGFRRSILFETTLDFLQVFFGERLCKNSGAGQKLQMDYFVIGSCCSLHYGFTHRRVRVNGFDDIVCGNPFLPG